MRVIIRRFGNSRGVVIPKALLRRVGLEGQGAMSAEGGALVLRPVRLGVRAGWADSSRRIAAAEGDALILPAFQNEEDKRLIW